MQSERHRVRDRMVHMDKFHIKAAQANGAAGLRHIETGLSEQAVLAQLALDQADRKARGIHGQVYTFKQIRQRADVVLVPVGDHDSADAIRVALHKGEVGQDEIHAEHIAVREGHAAIHDNHILAAFIQRKVLSDLIQAAQEIHPHGRFCGSRLSPSAVLLARLLCSRRPGRFLCVLRRRVLRGFPSSPGRRFFLLRSGGASGSCLLLRARLFFRFLRRAAARLALARLLLRLLPVFPGNALRFRQRDGVPADLLIRRFSDWLNFPIQSDCIFI